MKNYEIIVAAGTGSRYGGNLPKQFCDLGGRPLLMTTMERLHKCDEGCSLIVVLSREMTGLWQQMCEAHSFSIPHSIVEGGAARSLSVRNALDFIEGLPGEKGLIGIHDAARPVVTRSLIDGLIATVSEGADGAIPACAVTDSLRVMGDDGVSSEAVDRSRFRAVQTPQIFPASKLFDAYRRMLPHGDDDTAAAARFTDDASVMEAAGYTRLRLSEGDPRNIKVTNPGDMEIAALYLGSID